MINNIFQAKYEVSKLRDFSGFADAEKLVSTYMKTGLLVYPHQIVAALSALDDPMRKGFILADEVGLGKGIEAMLVVSQHYWDGKRICIIVPNPLEQMWRELITGKFGLPIADGLCTDKEDGENKIVLTTYTAAVERAEELKVARFDYVVFEEAHRLRKFHTGENKTAIALCTTFDGVKKLLLTATPMQKNVMDIYGLINFIDSGVLGDADEFYKRYYKKPENYAELKDILSPYIFRTLRSQVKADVNLPERNILTYSYKLEQAAERELNDKLLKYLGKPNKVAFPEMDNYELTLMLEKILASSVYALSKTLSNIIMRLRKMGTAEAQAEADEIQELLTLAVSIKETSKDKAFIKALDTAMRGLKENEQNCKCLIFTDNTETQKHIIELMRKHTNFKVAAYNGTTGIDPIIEFKGKANILVSTDNGAEGFDFTHCNLVINFDNLWLASAIEQRIGRCHRIGQKSDVAVINFLCTELLADIRFYELAYKRLNMFGGILGATDNVVSDISSGEIERRIQEVLSATRNAKQTESDYKEATAGLEDDIENTRTDANTAFFRTFDAEIASKTKNYVELIKQKSAELKDKLWDVARYHLKGKASFYEEDGKRSFSLSRSVFKSGNYTLSPYYIDYDRDMMQSQKFTLHNRIANEIIGQIQIINQTKRGRLTLDGGGNMKGVYGTIAMYTLHLYSFKEYSTITKTMFIGYDNSGRELSESVIKSILDLSCLSSSDESHGREYEKINVLKEKILPQVTEQIKANFEGVIANGIKRIKAEGERERFAIKVDIDNAEKELARITRDSEKTRDEFAASQRIAEASGRLKALKENEFTTKIRLKKQVDERIKEFLKQFEFSLYTSEDFIIDFEVRG